MLSKSSNISLRVGLPRIKPTEHNRRLKLSLKKSREKRSNKTQVASNTKGSASVLRVKATIRKNYKFQSDPALLGIKTWSEGGEGGGCSRKMELNRLPKKEFALFHGCRFFFGATSFFFF